LAQKEKEAQEKKDEEEKQDVDEDKNGEMMKNDDNEKQEKKEEEQKQDEESKNDDKMKIDDETDGKKDDKASTEKISAAPTPVEILTELANSILSSTGNMDIYQETWESIQYKVRIIFLTALYFLI
jgi:hypothetical protein